MRRLAVVVVAVAVLVGESGGTSKQPDFAHVVESAKRLATQQRDPVPLGKAGRRDYLEVAAGVFEVFEQLQRRRDEPRSGAILDPVRLKEHQYSTPCFAHVGATLLRGGWFDDSPDERRAAVLAAVELAVDRCLAFLVEEPSEDTAKSNSNFYTAPLALAIRALAGISTPEKHATWCALFRAFDPSLYVVKNSKNWHIVAAAGEHLRLFLGLHHSGSRAYIKSVFAQTASQWGPNGEFLDKSGCDGKCNPAAYDNFARYFITIMLANGLDEPQHRERNREAAWLSMLMQSPWGEAPTGGRSAQHQWNEAQMCATFEFWAAEYAKEGDHSSAKIFKRAAALALGSVRRWRRPAGDLNIVKNHFPISERHGYEGYSYHSTYNLLAASMLSSAFELADDTVPEGASFAETGGFAFQTAPLNKAFANAGGMYVEVELRPDEQRDTLGLTRVHTSAVDPRLSVTAGIWRQDNPLAVGVGVVWDVAEPGGESTRALADFTFKEATASATLEQPQGNDRAVFSVEYAVPGAEVHESYSVSPSEVQVAAHLFPANGSEITGFGVSFPAFITDGESNATVATPDPTGDPEVRARAQVTMRSAVYIPLRESCVWFEVLSEPPPACNQAKGWVWDLAADRSYSRNGFAKALLVKCTVVNPAEAGLGHTDGLAVEASPSTGSDKTGVVT